MKMTLLRKLFLAVSAASMLTGSLQARPLEIWISSFADKTYYEAMVKLYQTKVDTNFQANIQAFGFKEMPDKFAVAMRTKVNPPDIIQLDEIMLGLYLEGDAPFVDLTDRIKKAGLDKDIAAQRLGIFTYQGKTYGLPQSLSAMVLWYRTDLFQKSLVTPERISTWDDFAKIGKDLAAFGQTTLALDASYFEILLRQRGSDLLDDKGNVFPDMELAEDTLNFLHSLKEQGIGLLSDRETIFDPVFFSGPVEAEQVYAIMAADWYGLDMIQQFAPGQKGKWAAMPLPAWKNKDGSLSKRTSTWAGQGLLIYKETTEQEAAWKFMEFVMKDKDANTHRFVDGNSFPAYKPSWTDPAMQKPWPYFGNQELGKLLNTLGPDVPKVVTGPKRPQIVFMLQETFMGEFMEDRMTAKEMLEKIKELMK